MQSEAPPVSPSVTHPVERRLAIHALLIAMVLSLAVLTLLSRLGAQ